MRRRVEEGRAAAVVLVQGAAAVGVAAVLRNKWLQRKN
jgi:hypothetical protein